MIWLITLLDSHVQFDSMMYSYINAKCKIRCNANIEPLRCTSFVHRRWWSINWLQYDYTSAKLNSMKLEYIDLHASIDIDSVSGRNGSSSVYHLHIYPANSFQIEIASNGVKFKVRAWNLSTTLNVCNNWGRASVSVFPIAIFSLATRFECTLRNCVYITV